MPLDDIALIDDDTAHRYYNSLTTLEGPERDAVIGSLESYWRKQEEERQEQDYDRFKELYTNPAAFDDFAKDPAIQNAQKWSLDPEAMKFGVANRQYLSSVVGRDLEGLEYEQERDNYAKRRWGMEEVDDKTFFKKNGEDFESFDAANIARLDLQRDFIIEAATSAAEGRPRDFTTPFNNWRATRQGIVSDEIEGAFFTEAHQLATETVEKIGKYAPEVGSILQLLEGMKAGTATTDDIAAVAKMIGQIPSAERARLNDIAAVAASDLTDDQRAGFGQVIENAGRVIGRSLTQYGEAFQTATLQTRETAIQAEIERIESGAAIPKGPQTYPAARTPEQLEAPMPVEDRAARIAELKAERNALQATRELKDTFDNKVNPIRPVYSGGILSALEQGTYVLAGTTTHFGAAAVPYIGPALNFIAIQDGEYNRLMLDNPDMDPRAARIIAGASAVPQAFMDHLQYKALAGKLPGTAQFLATMNNKYSRVLSRVAVSTGLQNLEEAVQDAASQAIPAMLSHLREDMPDKDPEAVFDAWLAERPAVFFGMAPIGLIGGGFASVQDFKNLNSVLSPRNLHYAGFDEEQIVGIRTAYDPTAAVQAAYPNRTPENIATGIASYEADIEQAAAAQRDPLQPTMEVVTKADGTKEYRVLRSVPEEIQTEFLADEELEGKQVTLQFTDAETGRTVTEVFDAVEAQNRVKTNLSTYQQLIDCLGQ